ncbi:GntR family transcriptional regulator [Aquipuribacter sp. MA13-6]|uniref:GntR family transcriptional regulator n=1 Tax=unclassified Aquipuribacter TaxID=2635084 RepID=UPI003EEE676C
MDDDRPIFRQVAELVEQAIVDGSLPEDAQAPSTNELAAFHRINPATAAKGLHQLLADGILTKRRGIGMFVVPGAREKVLQRRRDEFLTEYVRPMVAEATTLGIDRAQLHRMLDDAGSQS